MGQFHTALPQVLTWKHVVPTPQTDADITAENGSGDLQMAHRTENSKFVSFTAFKKSMFFSNFSFLHGF